MKSYDAAIYRSMPIRNATPNSSRLNNKINYKRIFPKQKLFIY